MAVKVCLIPNDFTMDLEAVCKLCDEEHVEYVELGLMWNESILELDESKLAKVHELLDSHNLQVASIQTQIMKVLAPNSTFAIKGSKKMHLDHTFNVSQIDKAIALATDFNAPYIVTYSYFRRGTKVNDANWQSIFQDYKSFLPKLQEADKTVVVECEPDTFIHSVDEYVQFFQQFNDSHIQANLDLANLIEGQKHFTHQDFDKIFPYVPYFHVKDRKIRRIFGSSGAIFSQGSIPWKEALPWFVEKGFEGVLSVEPHVGGENKFEKGRKCVENLQHLLMDLQIPYE